MRRLFLIILLVSAFFLPVSAQFSDDFSDGDFTANPVWNGETAVFQVNANMLQSNGPAATDTLHLYTASSVIDSTEWEFLVRLDFQPSTSNYVRIYLVSDQSNLEGALNGYFLEIGETGSADTLRFFRQDGATTTEIATGSSGCVTSTTSNLLRIRVRRDNSGNWNVESDCSGGFNYLPELSTTDATYTTTSFFGVLCRHTSTRNDKFFFDDFYVGGYQLDTVPPDLLSASPTSSTLLDVSFSEPVDLTDAQTAANYSVNNGIGNPVSALRDGTDSSLVHLTFGTAFANGQTYTLTASGIADVIGNTMPAAQQTNFFFLIPDTAQAGDVVLNEIFADPDTTATNMPNGEWVELWNLSGSYFDLDGWIFSDATSSITLDPYLLGPNEYVVICKTADTAALGAFGPVLGMGSLPSLNNGGDALGLRNAQGSLLDSVEYDISWYQDPVKESGGWSLERINPSDTCASDNWIASSDPDGGTPGTQNSEYDPTPDTTPPSLLSVTVVDALTLTVCFDEAPGDAAQGIPSFYSIDNGIGQPASAASAGGACVTLTLSTPIDTGTVYTITVSGIFDCNGNTAGSESLTFVLGAGAAAQEVIFTEIFPDPSPVVGLPEAEFVEIHNRGTAVISLADWTLEERGGNSASLPAVNIFPGDYIILCAHADTSLYGAFGTTYGMSSMPSLNNTSDSLELRDANGALIDAVYYDDSWYADESKADGGYTLERLDLDFPCMNAGNWRASQAAQGGTPGAVNSISGTFSDSEAPRMVSAVLLDPTLLKVTFSEIMDPATAGDVSRYTIDNGVGQPLAAVVSDPVPSAVTFLLPAGIDTQTVYCITADSLRDCAGNLMESDNQACFGIPQDAAAGDIILNEILFNPYTGGSDYVELYNLSDKIIDLQTLFIAEIYEGTDSIFNASKVTDIPALLLPQSYLCLTADKNFQILTYMPPYPDNIFEMNDFPSYDDNEGECVIYTVNGDILDRFHYLDDYQFQNLDDDNGVSLERLSFYEPTQDEGNWHSAASTVLYGTPGYKNSQQLLPGDPQADVWVEPKVFSPDSDGRDDVTGIHYTFTTPGQNARVLIYDARGRLVKTLQQNTLLSTETGTFTWDGTDDNGHKAQVGTYVILFEVTEPDNGAVNVMRLTVVLAARM